LSHTPSWPFPGGGKGVELVYSSGDDDGRVISCERDASGNPTFQKLRIQGKPVIFDEGKVGIGTTDPGAKLDVRGSAVFNEDGGDHYFRVEGKDISSMLFIDASLNRACLGTDRSTVASSTVIIENDGTNDVALFVTGEVNSQHAIKVTDAQGMDSAIYSESYYCPAVTAKRSGPNPDLNTALSVPQGRVGIGTTSPGEKLDVNGNIKIGSSDAFYFGASTGTVGSWRIVRSGNDLVFQRCTSTGPDVWTTKYTISA
jgi:hypothetical protein